MTGQRPTDDRTQARRNRTILIVGLIGLGVVVAVRSAVSGGVLNLVERLVLVGVIGVLLGLAIRKLFRHLPAHPILAALVCGVSAVVLSVPVFVALNILIPTEGKQAHMWGDVQGLERFYYYVVFGLPGAGLLGAATGAVSRLRHR